MIWGIEALYMKTDDLTSNPKQDTHYGNRAYTPVRCPLTYT